MQTYLSIILICVSSLFGYLLKTKVDSSCCCCTLKLERDNDNKMKGVSMLKKSRINTGSATSFEEKV